jgi:hypothetical protein
VPGPAPKLDKLASARGGKLLRVVGGFFEGTLDKTEIPGAPGPGDWEMSGLTLEFNGHQPLGLAGEEHGEGFKCVAPDMFWEGLVVRDLTGVEPFASVAGTRFQELTLLSYPPPYDQHHVGIRLQFQGGSLVFHNLWDFFETYDGQDPNALRPPHADAVLEEHPWSG